MVTAKELIAELVERTKKGDLKWRIENWDDETQKPVGWGVVGLDCLTVELRPNQLDVTYPGNYG